MGQATYEPLDAKAEYRRRVAEDKAAADRLRALRRESWTGRDARRFLAMLYERENPGQMWQENPGRGRYSEGVSEAPCDECGRTYRPTRSTQRYCSSVCRDRSAYRAKQAAKAAAAG